VSEKVSTTEAEKSPSGTSWNSPGGLDLNPRPPETVRISRKASMALVGVVILLLALFAYGGWKRRQRQVAAYADANLPKRVAPATSAAAEIENRVPAGNVPTAGVRQAAAPQSGRLQAPEEVAGYGSNPAVAARNTVPQPTPVYIRQAAAVTPVTAPVSEVHQPTPEEQRLQAAYESEQRAMVAPTGIDSGFGAVTTGGGSNPSLQLASAQAPLSVAPPIPAPLPDQEKSSSSPQEQFLKSARTASPDDYLKSTRTAPLSPYEIQAGWEIPAVMEQFLNSDLPGEVKALVTSNVYDTATGQYVLIPQGARVVGEYNSKLGYSQDGVQVVWNQLIYPDGSSLDLSGMLGQDEHGFSGFRDKVDHHYKRLIGFAVLTSMFAAASNIAQNQNRSVLVYPSPGAVAGSAVGQQVSDLGAQITRRNLNVQPTVKIPVGYRFNVRVNRHILFDLPYALRN
jgi:type IV secretion system protein TrbI